MRAPTSPWRRADDTAWQLIAATPVVLGGHTVHQTSEAVLLPSVSRSPVPFDRPERARDRWARYNGPVNVRCGCFSLNSVLHLKFSMEEIKKKPYNSWCGLCQLNSVISH